MSKLYTHALEADSIYMLTHAAVGVEIKHIVYCISLRLDAVATIFSLHILVRLLYIRGYMAFISLESLHVVSSTMGWIRCIWVKQRRLLDTECSLSVLLYVRHGIMSYNTKSPSVARWASPYIIHIRVHVPRIVASATNRGWHLFEEIWYIMWPCSILCICYCICDSPG